MRLFLAALLSLASFGCGDDDAEGDDGGTRDAGNDAATDDMRDADVPTMDGRVTDSSDEDASSLSDAGDGGGDGGDDGGACLEASYIWEQFTVCSGERTLYSARRVTLTKLCENLDCPPDWNAALAVAATGECDEEDDAGGPCWRAVTECGSNLLRTYSGPNESFLYYDQATGKLLGAASQFTDSSLECVASENVAGERPPLCCEVPDAS